MDFKSLEDASRSPWEILSGFCYESWTNNYQGWEDVHSNTHGKVCKGVLEAIASHYVLGEHISAQPTSNACTWF